MPNGESKNWIRFCGAINGFRARYNRWPEKISVPRFFVHELKNALTPKSFNKLNSKVKLVVEDSPFVAADGLGNQYNYGIRGFSKVKSDISATEWLDVEPDFMD